jgi:uncharacterized oligopeptide transporter (OPT) family protein
VDGGTLAFDFIDGGSIEADGLVALTFALGMYLPLELNSPALVGGYLHHLVTKKAAKQD